MDIYSKKDLEVFKKNIKEVIKKVKKKSLSILEPTKTEIENAQKIILNYIIKKKGRFMVELL